MTPGARIAAAIEILDKVLAGDNAERALTNWGRASRFAGSGDRGAVRDLVFDALRSKRSFAALGGAETGRGLMLGAARASGQPIETLFSGEGHAPAAATAEEIGRAPDAVEALNLPDWLLPELEQGLGDRLPAVAGALAQRAPVFLRVNAKKATLDAAISMLAGEGVEARPHPMAPYALEVVSGAKRVQLSQCYLTGLVELQDAASQAVVAALPLADGMKVLDHCAGGGGKTLAMAAQARITLFAHDTAPARMRDLPARATRAGAKIQLSENPENRAPYDLILADAPCSGSGSWRRDPQGKWSLTPDRLAQIIEVQAAILARLAPMVAHGGVLAYATCSVLPSENDLQIDAFLAANPDFSLIERHHFTPLSGGDGFFLATLRKV